MLVAFLHVDTHTLTKISPFIYSESDIRTYEETASVRVGVACREEGTL